MGPSIWRLFVPRLFWLFFDYSDYSDYIHIDMGLEPPPNIYIYIYMYIYTHVKIYSNLWKYSEINDNQLKYTKKYKNRQASRVQQIIWLKPVRNRNSKNDFICIYIYMYIYIYIYIYDPVYSQNSQKVVKSSREKKVSELPAPKGKILVRH